MGQKETIVNLLNTYGTMTQRALAEAIYGDKNHGPNIYAALMGLVNSGAVLRTGSNPSYYSLSGVDIIIPEKPVQTKKGYRDVTGDAITNEAMEEAEALVQGTDNYGPENELITRCLQKFPMNTDPDVVAMKVGLIDITNSTHLSQHKSKISMVELANIIAAIPNIEKAHFENGIYFNMIDVEKYAHKFTFPAPGKTCGFVHDSVVQELGEDKPIITLGHGPDFGVIRATDAVNEKFGFSVNNIVPKLAEMIPSAGIDGGGHECAGSIKYIEGLGEEVLDGFVNEIRNMSEL